MPQRHLTTTSNSQQASHISIPDLRVATIGVRVIVLPEAVEWPAAGDGAGDAGVAGEDERVGVDKGVGVARAGLPPGAVGVEERVDARARAVRVAEVPDPVDGRGRREHAAALEVQHARQCDAVAGPPATVGDEVVGLRRARADVKVRVVVTAADETRVGGADVVLAEAGVLVACSFGGLGKVVKVSVSERKVVFESDSPCVFFVVGVTGKDGPTYLDHDETSSRGVSTGVVDAALPVRDIEAVNGGHGAMGKAKQRSKYRLHDGEVMISIGQRSSPILC